MSDMNKDVVQKTEAERIIGELNAGIVAKKLGHVLTDVASNCVAHAKKGEVTLKIKFEPSEDVLGQIKTAVDVSYKQPKAGRGHTQELDGTDTVMYIGKKDGKRKLTAYHDDFDKDAIMDKIGEKN